MAMPHITNTYLQNYNKNASITMLILHRSRMAPEMKQNHLLFWSFSGSSSCIRHANYIHICAFSNEHRGDNEAILSVASAGRLLNTFH